MEKLSRVCRIVWKNIKSNIVTYVLKICPIFSKGVDYRFGTLENVMEFKICSIYFLRV